MLIYVPITPDTANMRSFLGEPTGEYFLLSTGKRIGVHYRVNEVLLEKLQRRYGNVFEVCQ